MALILSIETSTRVCSVSLHEGQKVIGLKELFTDKSHSSLLAILIRDLIAECGYKTGDLNAVAVSKGPGSFTGLRIGISAAKGLCYALDVPLISVNTLEAMVKGMLKYNLLDALLCPMLDARRMEVYCLIADNRWKIYEETQAVIVDENSFADLLANKKIIFYGPGAQKIENMFKEKSNAIFIKEIYPSAMQIGHMAFNKFVKGDFENLAYFEPFYLKEFISKKPKSKF
jgi:tRNA threonylcarbamoyladenosine biosynthesis protein TsaB